MSTSKYFKAWKDVEDSMPRPSRCRQVVEYDYREFAQRVEEEAPAFVEQTVQSIFSGDLFILRNCVSPKFIQEVKERTWKLWKDTPESFHKILEGCPDFHRILTQEIAKNYSFKNIRHSSYFFPWNSDPVQLRPVVMERWRLLKYIQGYQKDEWELNTPKDGVVDRLQVAMYPRGSGYSEMHADPIVHQKLFISIYMSKRGKDFDQGGFYVVDSNDQIRDCEGDVEVGDLAFGYGSIVHGVAEIDPQIKIDWESDRGRWWIGLYSISSNEMVESKRATGRPVSIAAS